MGLVNLPCQVLGRLFGPDHFASRFLDFLTALLDVFLEGVSLAPHGAEGGGFLGFVACVEVLRSELLEERRGIIVFLDAHQIVTQLMTRFQIFQVEIDGRLQSEAGDRFENFDLFIRRLHRLQHLGIGRGRTVTADKIQLFPKSALELFVAAELLVDFADDLASGIGSRFGRGEEVFIFGRAGRIGIEGFFRLGQRRGKVPCVDEFAHLAAAKAHAAPGETEKTRFALGAGDLGLAQPFATFEKFRTLGDQGSEQRDNESVIAQLQGRQRLEVNIAIVGGEFFFAHCVGKGKLPAGLPACNPPQEAAVSG